jgi:hypothetical protein
MPKRKQPTRARSVPLNLEALSRHLKKDLTGYVPRPVKLSSSRVRPLGRTATAPAKTS